MQGYDDIMDKDRPVLVQYPRMPVADRAAQFSPFAALNGHSAAIAETARQTDCRIVLEEDERERLDENLQVILGHLAERPQVTLTYFVEDEKKQGGVYKTLSGRVTSMDAYGGILHLATGESIPVADVIALEYIPVEC